MVKTKSFSKFFIKKNNITKLSFLPFEKKITKTTPLNKRIEFFSTIKRLLFKSLFLKLSKKKNTYLKEKNFLLKWLPKKKIHSVKRISTELVYKSFFKKKNFFKKSIPTTPFYNIVCILNSNIDFCSYVRTKNKKYGLNIFTKKKFNIVVRWLLPLFFGSERCCCFILDHNVAIRIKHALCLGTNKDQPKQFNNKKSCLCLGSYCFLDGYASSKNCFVPTAQNCFVPKAKNCTALNCFVPKAKNCTALNCFFPKASFILKAQNCFNLIAKNVVLETKTNRNKTQSLYWNNWNKQRLCFFLIATTIKKQKQDRQQISILQKNQSLFFFNLKTEVFFKIHLLIIKNLIQNSGNLPLPILITKLNKEIMLWKSFLIKKKSKNLTRADLLNLKRNLFYIHVFCNMKNLKTSINKDLLEHKNFLISNIFSFLKNQSTNKTIFIKTNSRIYFNKKTAKLETLEKKKLFFTNIVFFFKPQKKNFYFKILKQEKLFFLAKNLKKKYSILFLGYQALGCYCYSGVFVPKSLFYSRNNIPCYYSNSYVARFYNKAILCFVPIAILCSARKSVVIQNEIKKNGGGCSFCRQKKQQLKKKKLIKKKLHLLFFLFSKNLKNFLTKMQFSHINKIFFRLLIKIQYILKIFFNTTKIITDFITLLYYIKPMLKTLNLFTTLSLHQLYTVFIFIYIFKKSKKKNKFSKYFLDFALVDQYTQQPTVGFGFGMRILKKKKIKNLSWCIQNLKKKPTFFRLHLKKEAIVFLLSLLLENSKERFLFFEEAPHYLCFGMDCHACFTIKASVAIQKTIAKPPNIKQRKGVDYTVNKSSLFSFFALCQFFEKAQQQHIYFFLAKKNYFSCKRFLFYKYSQVVKTKSISFLNLFTNLKRKFFFKSLKLRKKKSFASHKTNNTKDFSFFQNQNIKTFKQFKKLKKLWFFLGNQNIVFVLIFIHIFFVNKPKVGWYWYSTIKKKLTVVNKKKTKNIFFVKKHKKYMCLKLTQKYAHTKCIKFFKPYQLKKKKDTFMITALWFSKKGWGYNCFLDLFFDSKKKTLFYSNLHKNKTNKSNNKIKKSLDFRLHANSKPINSFFQLHTKSKKFLTQQTNYLNCYIYKLLWKWAKKKYGNHSNIWILKKHWKFGHNKLSFFTTNNTIIFYLLSYT